MQERNTALGSASVINGIFTSVKQREAIVELVRSGGYCFPMDLRFDDMFAHISRLAEDSAPAAQNVAYRQLIDLFAQGRLPQGHANRELALQLLERCQPRAPAATRREMARLVADYAPGDWDVIGIVVDDSLEIIEPVLLRAQLPEEVWLLLLNRLPPAAAAVLDVRTDLPPRVQTAIARARWAAEATRALGMPPIAMAAADPAPEPDVASAEPETPAAPQGEAAVLEAGDELPADFESSEQQIQELIRRILAYQERRRQAEAGDTASAGEPGRIIPWPLIPLPGERQRAPEPQRASTAMEDIVRAATDWCWETDRQGNFTYLDAPDAALRPDGLNGLAGMNLFDWLPDSPAFDAVRLAYLRHAPFRAQTVHIERGAAAGIWSLAGVPVFEDASGQFQGYRGTAIAVPSELAHRVPSTVAPKSPDSGADDDSSVDRMYMLAHELRSPLNAILGFAQMIEREALGAVGDDYRAQAGGILNAGGRLLHLVEEFLEAARTPDSEVAQPCALNAPAFVGDVVDSLSDHARHAGVYLISRVSTAVRTITAEPQGLRRALSRAILKMIDIAGRDQTVIVSAQVEPGDRVRLIVHCPVLAASLEATTESGDFSLHLLRQQAERAGATVEVDAHGLSILATASGHDAPPADRRSAV